MPLTLKERFRGAIERGMIEYARELHPPESGPAARELELIGEHVAPLLDDVEREHVAEVRAYQVADQDTRRRITELELARDAAKRSLNFADARADRLETQLARALERLGLPDLDDVEDLEAYIDAIPTVLERLERVASTLEARALDLDEGHPRIPDADRCGFGLRAGKHHVRCHLPRHHTGNHTGEDDHGMSASWPTANPDCTLVALAPHDEAL